MTVSPSPYAGTSPVVSLSHTEGAVTLVEGQTFCLSGRTGDINPDMAHGLFVLDSRVLSCWQLRVNGARVEPLSLDVPSPFSATFVGRAQPQPGHADSAVVVFRDRDIGHGLRDQIAITNFGPVTTHVTVEIVVDADFADLFEVKERRRTRRRRVLRANRSDGFELVTGAAGDRRRVLVTATMPFTVNDRALRFSTSLGPDATWSVCVALTVTLRAEPLKPHFTCDPAQPDTVPEQRLASWRATLPRVRSDHDALDRVVLRAGEDLGALRIFDPDHPDDAIVAAGAPWFMTVFGRDSILTSWMTLLADSRLAEGVLATLARFQGSEENAESEEEPGKILHEMRFGAAARSSLSSAEVYYGSIDATPLFVMLLGELRRWGLADSVVDRLLPHVDRALTWIRDYGDRDKDGYVEYGRRNPRGLANQGWKDSWDAIRFADGRFARVPIALCEVQGYVYAAYLARAHFAWEHGDERNYARYTLKAKALYEQFNRDFWLDDREWYALGLDADKQPIEALTSNIGHCLWTGIVDPDRAAIVAERLRSPEMFSGWGVRTLATSMAAYNPVSYHNGSVWPHDNAIVAAGLARYGFVEDAHRIIGGQLAAATASGLRLPELFAGFTRGRPATPAAYPTSCSPQAWAAAAPLLWLRTLLRFDPWIPHHELRVDPALPDWLRSLHVDDIEVGGRTVGVHVEGDDVEVTGAGELAVRAAREPLTAAQPTFGE
jgi:glycogen debranching enzyme